MNWKTIFNPFEKFSETKLAIAGIALTLAGSLVGAVSGATYDGVLSVHTPAERSFITSLAENGINIAICFVFLLIPALLINKKTRWIDIAVTAMIYRAPIYGIAALGGLPFIHRVNKGILDNVKAGNYQFNNADLGVVLLFGIITLAMLAYAVVLLVNGFKTAANVKKWQHFVLFAVVLLLAAMISTRFIHRLF